ncbi:MAG: hypothetical protein RIK87_24525 [Fuerstiella sp.]
MTETDDNKTLTSVKVDTNFRLPGVAFCAAAGEQASTLYFGCSDFGVYRLESTAEKPEAVAISEQRHHSYVTGIVRRGPVLVSGSYDGSIVWWTAETGEIIHRAERAHDKWIRQLAISPDKSIVASVGDDMKTRLWDAETHAAIAAWDGYESTTPHGYPSMLYAVAFSPDGKWLATGNRTGRVLVRAVATGEPAAELETPVMYTWDPKARRHSIGGVRSLAFSHDSKRLAVGGMGQVGNIDHLQGNSRIEIFDWQSGERQHEIEDSKYKGLVECLAFGPEDRWLVAAGGDNSGFVSVYGTAETEAKLLAQEKAPMHVHDFVLNENGSALTAVGHEQGCVISLA